MSLTPSTTRNRQGGKPSTTRSVPGAPLIASPLGPLNEGDTVRFVQNKLSQLPRGVNIVRDVDEVGHRDVIA